MKIKTRMLAFIAFPILMAILLIAGSSYVYSSRMVEDLSKREMLETAKKYGSNLETFIAKQIANVDMLSDSITMSDLSDKELYKELIYVTDKNSDILAAFAGFSDKRFFNGSQLPVPADYDPTTRDWYGDSMKSDRPYVSIPYIDAASGDTVITVSTQIKKDGNAIGVLGFDITMKTVNELVNGIKLYDTGFAYIIDSEGYIVSYKDYEPSEELSKIEDGSKADLVDPILEGEDETFYSVEDGVKRINSKYDISGTDWILVVSVPEAEVMSGVLKLSIFMITIGTLFFVVILGLLLWIIKSITHPIAALGSDMEKLAEQNIEVQLVEHEAAITMEDADRVIEGIPGVRTKTLFLMNKKKTKFYLLIMDEDKRLDMTAFKELVDDRQLKMASEEMLYEKLGLQPGVVSPFGLLNDKDGDVEVYIDKDIADEERMSFHPNTNEKTVFIKTVDLYPFLEHIGHPAKTVLL